MDFEKYIESKLKSVDTGNQISSFLSPGSLELSNIQSQEGTPAKGFNQRQQFEFCSNAASEAEEPTTGAQHILSHLHQLKNELVSMH